MPGGLREVVLSFKFRQNRLNGCRDLGGRNLPFPILKASGFYNINEWTVDLSVVSVGYFLILVSEKSLFYSIMRKLNDDDLARGPEEVFTIISKIGRG